MKIRAALVGDSAGHLTAETGALASHDESGLLGESGRDLDFFQDVNGGFVVFLAAIEGRGLAQGLIDRFDGLVFEEA